MTVTTMAVTGTLENPDGSTATGTVTFTPATPGAAHFANGGVTVPVAPVVKTLVAGAIPGGFSLVRCPAGYRVVERTSAQPSGYTYLIPDQAGPVDLSSFH